MAKASKAKRTTRVSKARAAKGKGRAVDVPKAASKAKKITKKASKTTKGKEKAVDKLLQDGQERIRRMTEQVHDHVEQRGNILVEGLKVQSDNTRKSYEPKIKQFQDWCYEQSYDDDLVTSDKLAFFIEFVIDRGHKLKKAEDGSSLAISKQTVESYVKAVCALYREQRDADKNKGPSPRSQLVRSVMAKFIKDNTKRRLEGLEDRGVNTINDGYNRTKLEEIAKYFMERDNMDGLRDKVCFLMSHSMLLRSQNALGMQLSFLQSFTVPNQGPSEFLGISAKINYGKQNSHGKDEFGNCVRHRSVNVCPVGAVAMHLFARFHIAGEAFPCFESRASWYKIALVPVSSADPTALMSYEAQRKMYQRVINACGVVTSAVTHVNRKSAVNMLAEDGINYDELRRMGRWAVDRMTGCYISSYPLKGLKSMADFRTDQGQNYFLPRASIVPPKELQDMVFPTAEEELKLAREASVKELAVIYFLEMMVKLRVVFLQDAVALRQLYPDHFLWKSCPIFSTTAFQDFESRLLERMRHDETRFSSGERLALALPQLTSILDDRTSLMLGLLNSIKESTDAGFDALDGKFQGVKNDGIQTRQLWQDIFARGHAYFSSGATHPPSSVPMPPATASISAPIASAEASYSPAALSPAEPPSSTTKIPDFTLNRHLQSMEGVWREYVEPQPPHMTSVRMLEKSYGTTWRKSSSESRFFLRRKELYDAIEKTAEDEGIACLEAAKNHDKQRNVLGFSLPKYRDYLNREKRQNCEK